MTDIKAAWKDAGDRLSALGSSLKTHYEEQRAAEGERAGEETDAAAKKLTGAVQDAFDAMSATVKDPGVKDDVRKMGLSLAGALSATFAQASDELRKVADKAQAKAGGTTTEPTTTTTGAPSTTGAPTTTGGTADGSTTEPGGSTLGEPGAGGRDDEPPRVEPWGTP